MIDDINDARKIFAHICFYIIWSFEKFRNAVIQVGCDHSVKPAFLVIFIKFIQTVCNRVIELTPNGIIDKMMDYDDYITDEKVQAARERLYK